MTDDVNSLNVEHLTIDYVTADGTVHAVNDVSLKIARQKVMGLVGETGAEKRAQPLRS